MQKQKRTLNKIKQLPELTVSAAEHYIDIIYIQERKYFHSEQEIKYRATQKTCVNASIGGVGILSVLMPQNHLIAKRESNQE